MYISENKMIIYDILHGYFTPHTQNSRRQGHFILAKSSSWITDFRSSGLRLYMLRLIKITRTNFFKTQRRAVKRIVTKGQRTRKGKILEDRFR